MPLVEQIVESAVQYPRADLQQHVSAAAHLLFLVEALADHDVDGGLHE